MKLLLNIYRTLTPLFFLMVTYLPSWPQENVSLPDGVNPVWTIEQAYRETTPTQEKICINGLWLWQPANEAPSDIPTQNWGYIKVPAPWPGKSGNYMWRETQTAYPHPNWDKNLGQVKRVWYQREITIPEQWEHRRIALSANYVNSYAAVFVDGQKVGDIHFPGCEVEMTQACSPGKKHVLTLLIVAMPLKAVIESFNDTNASKQIEGDVSLRGLCGDVFLCCTPTQNRISDVKIETSVRKSEIGLDVELQKISAIEDYSLHAKILEGERIIEQFDSGRLTADRFENGRVSFRHPWIPDKLWDIHTPQNIYEIQVSLIDSQGNTVDEFYPVRFGFREFWIEGRDFYLNGSRLFFFAVPFDNAQISAAAATYEGACETMRRLKTFGVNAVYTHNYGCEPGVHLGFDSILKAADDMGMLIFFSQPHFSHYDWTAPDADLTNGYARHAEFYVRQAQNHPSIVMYSMSHNATGYNEDMNPDLIDGIHEKRDTWANRNAKSALRAEAIVRQLDPSRIVYHHAGGNLGPMHTSNFYLNFVPIQERSDWFEHWATEGVKPLFLCEYGVPWGINWTLYRGWYQGKRDFGGAKIPWQFCMAEWNAQFLGDRAYQLTERDKANLRFEAKQAREGKLWYRWDYPSPIIGSYAQGDDNQAEVWAMYIQDNWRAFRTWGISGFNAWSYGNFWELDSNADKNQKPLPVDWNRLQTPGFSPDFIGRQYESIDTAYEFSDWIPTRAGKALIQNNQPLLAYIAGKSDHFTSKDHNYNPGQIVDKQIAIINNSRITVNAESVWTLDLPEPLSGSERLTIETGKIIKIPLRITLPVDLPSGTYKLSLIVTFDSGQIQKDTFTLHVISKPKNSPLLSKIALYDPKGETKTGLQSLGISVAMIDSDTPLNDYDILVIGKEALTLDGPAPNIERIRDGLKVIVFEQASEVLEKRLGFRIQEYGLRRVFARIPDHPILSDLHNEHLRDWNGESTIFPPRLSYETRPMNGPTIRWCGMEATRPWRCGNWGNVASVLIEKPAIGDFLPIVDGGFNLQYSPLMEYREGKGTILFCQLDVTGRTDEEPVAKTLVANMLRYLSTVQPPKQRKALYAGESAGLEFFTQAGLTISAYEEDPLADDSILIVGPGGNALLTNHEKEISQWCNEGGQIIAIDMTQLELESHLPPDFSIQKTEYINRYFDPIEMDSPFAGINPADVMIRDPRPILLIADRANFVMKGMLGVSQNRKLFIAQLAPWQFGYSEIFHWKMTYRRISFAFTRLLANLGVRASTPLIERFSQPVQAEQDSTPESTNRQDRWLKGLYLDQPEEMDDPYRFFRW